MAEVRSQLLGRAVAAFVAAPSVVAGVRPLGDGNINDTFLVVCSPGPSLVLQRINPSVFPDPIVVAANTAVVSRHLSRIDAESASRGYRFPQAVATRDGLDWFEDSDGSIWRCQTYLDQTVSLERASSPEQAYQAGRLLGFFHEGLSGLDQRLLGRPLPGFHDLNRYRHAYREAVPGHCQNAVPDLGYCMSAAEKRLEDATLEELAENQGARARVIHGDPKCENFLFDADAKRAVSLIDLDTTVPGLTAVDIGDCLRSFCNPCGERGVGDVAFDLGSCRNLVAGYKTACAMTAAERRLIYHGLRLLTFELGLRFLTDYLEGNRYFKVADEQENLRRACIQFRLLESIEGLRPDIELIAGG